MYQQDKKLLKSQSCRYQIILFFWVIALYLVNAVSIFLSAASKRKPSTEDNHLWLSLGSTRAIELQSFSVALLYFKRDYFVSDQYLYFVPFKTAKGFAACTWWCQTIKNVFTITPSAADTTDFFVVFCFSVDYFAFTGLILYPKFINGCTGSVFSGEKMKEMKEKKEKQKRISSDSISSLMRHSLCASHQCKSGGIKTHQINTQIIGVSGLSQSAI